MKLQRPLVIGAAVLAAAGLAVLGVTILGRGGGNKTAYEYATITRGTIEKTVSSSGALAPVATVKILSRMSGKVEQVFVDFNDRVKKGDLLATLNTDMLKLDYQRQQAAVVQARANYELKKLNYETQQKLAAKHLVSDYELKTAKTDLDVQRAALSSAEASLAATRTEINQYASITSPIDGIVLERNISAGDTVSENSSANSSSLFTIAENLEEMQIEVGVGELDISSIFEGQDVRFTVEALPGRTFTGIVSSKRLVPTVTSSVVSYTVIINVQNQDGSLLPGMTCSVLFIQERRENVLVVPNAALRFQPSNLTPDALADRLFAARIANLPPEEQAKAKAAHAEAKAKAKAAGTAAPSGAGGLSGLMGGSMRQPGRSGTTARPSGAGGAAARPGGAGAGGARGSGGTPKPLWYTDPKGALQVIMVLAGVSDGASTEVRPLRRPGQEVANGTGGAQRTGGSPGDSGAGLEGMRVILREKI